MGQSPSRETDSRSNGQEIPPVFYGS